MAASGMGGRKPTTGRPVSRSSMGASSLYSISVQSFSRTPAMWCGVRNAFKPCSWAASVKLAPLGRTTSSTGRSSTSAVCQALAAALTPPRPS